jgi:hypothetical protein
MLYSNISVQSTLLEGYTANGSLLYRANRSYYWDPSYTSHAHGWSTGPTASLIFHLLGLTITQPVGREWRLQPTVEADMGVDKAEGGFETTLGWFGANWTLRESGVFKLAVDTPIGTKGVVLLPNQTRVDVDGGYHMFTLEGLV